MELIDGKGKEKGDRAELEFQKWLEKYEIHYLYIKQDMESFPKIFEQDKLKRPDFAILLPNLGFIMVDAKYKDVTEKYNDIAIDKIDFKKYVSFQNKFHIPVWYAVSNNALDYKTWFWIPISRVLELEPNLIVRVSPKSKQPYFPVKVNEFVKVEDNDSLAKIFSKSF